MLRAATVHAVTAIGIDMGKNTLHMIGLDPRGAIVLERRSHADALHEACELATLSHWHRSGNGDALRCSRACRAWPRCEAGPARVFESVSAGAKK